MSNKFTGKKVAAMETSASKSINILLLGEQGVGKTTLVNNLANCLKYKTLQEIHGSRPKIVVDTVFTLPNEDCKKQRVRFAANFYDNDNSSHESLNIKGETTTEDPTLYSIDYQDGSGETKFLNIIDTPGMFHLWEENEETFEAIFKCVRSLGVLHAICIVIKPDKTQFSRSFQCNVESFLSLLHENALGNVLFCVTHTHSVFTAGDTLTTLQDYLTKLGRTKNILVTANIDNICCIDNACFRYVLAVKSGAYQKTKNLDTIFGQSWEWNIAEFSKLLRKIENLPAISVKHLLNITQTHQLVTILAKPLLDIARNHLFSMRLAEDNVKQMKDVHKQMSNMQQQKEIESGQARDDYRDVIQRTEKLMEEEKQKNKSIEAELGMVRELCAESAVFLLENGFTEDPYRLQIEHLIRDEETKTGGGGNRNMYYELLAYLEQYTDKVKSLQKDVQENRKVPITYTQLLRKMDILTFQQHCGAQLRQQKTLSEQKVLDGVEKIVSVIHGTASSRLVQRWASQNDNKKPNSHVQEGMQTESKIDSWTAEENQQKKTTSQLNEASANTSKSKSVKVERVPVGEVQIEEQRTLLAKKAVRESIKKINQLYTPPLRSQIIKRGEHQFSYQTMFEAALKAESIQKRREEENEKVDSDSITN